jgi:pyruvate-formate lyase-activating enzyme
VIPGFNAAIADIDKIGEHLSHLPNIACVKLLPFHAYARSKYEALGLPDTTPCVETPAADWMNMLAGKLKEYGLADK